MKSHRLFLIFFLLLSFSWTMQGQDNTVVPQRTPEQEAVKQTEKMQQELNLSTEQARQIYEINLRYARERQISNTRSEAVERMKNKNSEVQKILTQEQNERLQSKRNDRGAMENPTVNGNHTQPPLPSGYRNPSEYRPTPAIRTTGNDPNLRSTYRLSSPPSQSNPQTLQSVRRSTSVTTSPQQTSTPTVAPSAIRSNQVLQTTPRQTISNPTPVNKTEIPVRK